LTALACLVVLPLLAYASPPDDGWIPGIYDNGDDDDVIEFLADTAAVEPSPRATADPVCAVRWLLANGTASLLPIASFLSSSPRSPPAI